jgi:hypothetical protein
MGQKDKHLLQDNERKMQGQPSLQKRLFLRPFARGGINIQDRTQNATVRDYGPLTGILQKKRGIFLSFGHDSRQFYRHFGQDDIIH